jgi:hypothetical protein
MQLGRSAIDCLDSRGKNGKHLWNRGEITFLLILTFGTDANSSVLPHCVECSGTVHEEATEKAFTFQAWSGI